MKVTIRRQKRKSLAFQVTPKGAVALIPLHLDADSLQVQQFIADALAKLPEPADPTTPLTQAQVIALVQRWAETLHVHVTRTQIRTMRNKWGSISTAGTLTLADQLLALPEELVEYVVVHELLHLKLPDHRTGWQVSMGMYLSDWRAREGRLAAYVGEVKRG